MKLENFIMGNIKSKASMEKFEKYMEEGLYKKGFERIIEIPEIKVENCLGVKLTRKIHKEQHHIAEGVCFYFEVEVKKVYENRKVPLIIWIEGAGGTDTQIGGGYSEKIIIYCPYFRKKRQYFSNVW